MSWRYDRRDDGSLIHCRPGRTRLDISVFTEFPGVNARRLARSIRQDIWRAVQAQPGFSPVIQVHPAPNGWKVVAGGQLDRPAPRAKLVETIEAVLNAKPNRARWLSYSRRTNHA